MKLALHNIALVSWSVGSAFLEQATGEQRPTWYELPPVQKEREVAKVRALLGDPNGELPSAKEKKIITAAIPLEGGDAFIDEDIEVDGLNNELMLAHLRKAVVQALR